MSLNSSVEQQIRFAKWTEQLCSVTFGLPYMKSLEALQCGSQLIKPPNPDIEGTQNSSIGSFYPTTRYQNLLISFNIWSK